jgi:hypothetical protein
LSCSIAQATLLVDFPEDTETQQHVVQCLKKYSFPSIDLADHQTLNQLTDHFTHFSNGTFSQTPQSTFVQRQLDQEGVSCPVIHIPSTIYELEVIRQFLVDKEFNHQANENAIQGSKNGVGIKNPAQVDLQFIKISRRLYPIFSAFNEQDEFLAYAKEQIASINALSDDQVVDRCCLRATQEYLRQENSQALILAIISHELQSQKEGKINFYRATAGIEYKKDRSKDENALAQHPQARARIEKDIQILYGFFCGEGVSSMQNICNGKYPPLSSDVSLDEILAFEKSYRNPNSIWASIISECAQNASGTELVVDYPYNHNPGETNPSNLRYKELSYSYTPLGGFIFDGVLAMQSACSFIYTVKNPNNYPFFYALSYKLPDFYNRYAASFVAPKTPVYQNILDSGEHFHPRFQLRSGGNMSTELADFYGNMKILGLFCENATTDLNKPFVQAIDNLHRELVESLEGISRSLQYSLAFDGGCPFVFSGFSGAEMTHRWTEGWTASIKIPLASEKHPKLQTIVFEKTSGLVTPDHSQRVYVYLNDNYIFDHEYTMQKPIHDIRIDIPDYLDGVANITFQLSNAESPAQLKINPLDPRLLAINFSDIKLIY